MTETLESTLKRYPGAETFRFADSETLPAALIAPVRSGRTRATCLSILNAKFGNTSPQIGRRDIAIKWDASSALLIETMDRRDVQFCYMSGEMALMGVENHSLAQRQEDHRTLFHRHGVFDPNMILTWEGFDVVEDGEDV